MQVKEIPMTPKNAELSERGRKVATTRGKPFGKVGDTFLIQHSEYEYTLMAVLALPLSQIRDQFYYAEGADSPEEFEKIYRAIYYGKFPAEKIKYLHIYSIVNEGE